jgi:pyruvate/oxaloacetate carboxyltransferase
MMNYIIIFEGSDMHSSEEWQEYVKGVLKAELKRRNISYKDLAGKLEPLGLSETERNIANKIARGGFTAVFFVQCLEAIGCHTVRLREPHNAAD